MEKENFNIFYLNFSKVYEIKLLINSVFTEKIVKENRIFSNRKMGIKIPIDEVTLNYGKNKGEFSKFTETITIKEGKSTVLNEIIELCSTPLKINGIKEGTLIKLDNVKLDFYDDEIKQRLFSLLRKEIFGGITYEGYDVNKLISAFTFDISYLLKGTYNNEEFVFKIPMESSSEFESNYTINDLLIGKLSIIGVYKGLINEEEFLQSNLFGFENENSNETDIIKSSSKKNYNKIRDNKGNTLHYIDIFAIIQNINLNNNENEEESKSFLHSIKQKIYHIKKYIFGDKNE